MIDYSDDAITAHIETHRETTRDHIKLSRIVANVPADVPEEDVTAHYLYYPSCVACSSGQIVTGETSQDVRDLSFEQFMNLPGPLFAAWVDKVFADNPHFLSAGDKALTAAGDTEKKASKKVPV